MGDPASTTFTLRIDPAIKGRLEELARSTGDTASDLAADAIDAYLDLNEWQVAGINEAMASLDSGEGIPHHEVKEWLGSWGTRYEDAGPRSSGL